MSPGARATFPEARATVQPIDPVAQQGRLFWGLAGCITLLLLGVYLLTNGGQTFISDGEVMLQTAVRIAEHQTITLTEAAAAFPQVSRGQGGFLFSRYGLGQPLAASVLYLLGKYPLGSWLLAGGDAFAMGRYLALLLPAFATALTGGLLFAWSARLYQSLRLGVALALLYGLCTLAWPYSRFFFSEPLVTCCLLLAAYALYSSAPLLGGLALGYALATHLGAVFVLPAFVAYLWLRGGRLRALVWLGLGLLPGLLLILANNWVRFRALTEQGYAGEGFTGDLLVGLAGLLVSPGKSVFLYVPLLLALPFALLPFVRRFRSEAVFIGLLVLITLLRSALWWTWWAGWGWGPRFLVPLMPFLVLLLGVLLAERGWRWLFGLLLVPLSLAVNALGILVDFNQYLSDITRGEQAREAIYLWQPAYSPILAHIRRLDWQQVPIVSFHLSRSDIGFPEPAATLLSAATVALTLGALAGLGWLLWQSHRAEHASSVQQVATNV